MTGDRMWRDTELGCSAVVVGRMSARSVAASFEYVWAEARTVSDAETAAAEAWWVDARAAVEFRAAVAECPCDRMAYAIATVSPGIPWAATLHNIDVLLSAMIDERPIPAGPGCGLELPLGRKHVEKAWSILHGGSTDACRGPKVEALAANLLGDMNRVTVDRHVTMVATGGRAQQVHVPEMKRIEAMMVMAAFARRIEPAILMTVMWMRRMRVRNVAGQALDPVTSSHEIALRRASA